MVSNQFKSTFELSINKKYISIMAKLNILVFIVLFIIGNIIIFKGPFKNLINGTGTTKYQKSDEIVEGN